MERSAGEGTQQRSRCRQAALSHTELGIDTGSRRCDADAALAPPEVGGCGGDLAVAPVLCPGHLDPWPGLRAEGLQRDGVGHNLPALPQPSPTAEPRGLWGWTTDPQELGGVGMWGAAALPAARLQALPVSAEVRA